MESQEKREVRQGIRRNKHKEVHAGPRQPELPHKHVLKKHLQRDHMKIIVSWNSLPETKSNQLTCR